MRNLNLTYNEPPVEGSANYTAIFLGVLARASEAQNETEPLSMPRLEVDFHHT